jgi:Uma2 family endonuclease
MGFRLVVTPPDFGELVPDLVVEIKSQSELIKPLEKKIKNFIELGAQVGILIDPGEETVTVYRQEGEPILLENEDILTVPELCPGWELPIYEL